MTNLKKQSEFQPLAIVVSSPSGAGKTTITRKLLSIYQNSSLSISVTTRARRKNEVNGQDYFFVSKEEFFAMIKDNELLEYAEVFGNHYGTPKKFILDQLRLSNHVIFDIDWQGAEQIAKHPELKIITIFILPPSIQALKERLIARGVDSEEVIQNRMAKAKSEISHYSDYDFVVLNDDIEQAIDKIKKIIDFHSLNTIKPSLFKEFVDKNLIN